MKYSDLLRFVLFFLILISCQHELPTSKPPKLDAAAIGKFHNEGLEYILTKLKENRSAEKITMEEFIDKSNSYGMDFIKLKNPDLSTTHFTEIETNMSMFQESLISRTAVSGRSMSIYDDMLSVAEPYLTSNQTVLINEIFDVLENQYSNLGTLQSSLNQIESSAESILSSSELPIIQTALSIARSSSEYWDQNYQAWESEICQYVTGPCGPSIGGRLHGNVNWGIVAAGDVAAGVIVGVTTSTALIVPFVGWGFWAAVTGGSALVTSAGAAIVMALSN